LTAIFSGEAGAAGKTTFKYPEGMAAIDVDGDGKLDLLAGNIWLKHRGGTNFEAIHIAPIGGRSNGKGEFRKTVFSTGIDFHEARVADLNGDGRPDILDKPYNWEAPRVDIWLQLAPE
jgi:hypothetical protein